MPTIFMQAIGVSKYLTCHILFTRLLMWWLEMFDTQQRSLEEKRENQ